MERRDLHFEPAHGSDALRLRHVETHLVRQGATLTETERERMADRAESLRRLQVLEKGYNGMLAWVGAQKVRWGVVATIVSIAGGVVAGLLVKWLG
jgi:hypothetical protein